MIRLRQALLEIDNILTEEFKTHSNTKHRGNGAAAETLRYLLSCVGGNSDVMDIIIRAKMQFKKLRRGILEQLDFGDLMGLSPNAFRIVNNGLRTLEVFEKRIQANPACYEALFLLYLQSTKQAYIDGKDTHIVYSTTSQFDDGMDNVKHPLLKRLAQEGVTFKFPLFTAQEDKRKFINGEISATNFLKDTFCLNEIKVTCDPSAKIYGCFVRANPNNPNKIEYRVDIDVPAIDFEDIMNEDDLFSELDIDPIFNGNNDEMIATYGFFTTLVGDETASGIEKFRSHLENVFKNTLAHELTHAWQEKVRLTGKNVRHTFGGDIDHIRPTGEVDFFGRQKVLSIWHLMPVMCPVSEDIAKMSYFISREEQEARFSSTYYAYKNSRGYLRYCDVLNQNFKTNGNFDAVRQLTFLKEINEGGNSIILDTLFVMFSFWLWYVEAPKRHSIIIDAEAHPDYHAYEIWLEEYENHRENGFNIYDTHFTYEEFERMMKNARLYIEWMFSNFAARNILGKNNAKGTPVLKGASTAFYKVKEMNDEWRERNGLESISFNAVLTAGHMDNIEFTRPGEWKEVFVTSDYMDYFNRKIKPYVRQRVNPKYDENGKQIRNNPRR